MAPRKSTESDKDKNNEEYSSENEGDVSNSNDDCGGSENEPIKKSNKANGKEASVDKNGEEDDNEETGDQDADEDENANGKNDDDEDDEQDDDAEDDDDDAPIKKRKTARKAAKPSKKKAAKASPKKKKAAGKKAVVEEENGEEEYEVKEVIDSKKEKNVLFYLIRWKGFTAADDTWEKAVNLTCDDLIAAFNKKNQNKKSAPTTTTTTAAAKQPPKKRKKVEENVDPEKEYEVDKVVDMEENKKGRVFRIRWKGYRPHQDTWEPEDNLNCKDLIEKFLIKHKADSEIPQKQLREEPKRTKRLVNETRYTPGARTSRRAAVKVRKTYYSEDENSD